MRHYDLWAGQHQLPEIIQPPLSVWKCFPSEFWQCRVALWWWFMGWTISIATDYSISYVSTEMLYGWVPTSLLFWSIKHFNKVIVSLSLYRILWGVTRWQIHQTRLFILSLASYVHCACIWMLTSHFGSVGIHCKQFCYLKCWTFQIMFLKNGPDVAMVQMGDHESRAWAKSSSSEPYEWQISARTENQDSVSSSSFSVTWWRRG